MSDMYYQDNDLCEICYANEPRPEYNNCNFDYYWINTHCIELRRNRESRDNKNVKTKETVF